VAYYSQFKAQQHLMADEIKVWEEQTQKELQASDENKYTTLPAVYNIMAMKARP
jgi:hypothetical protein